MSSHKRAGATLRALRQKMKLSQKALTAKTQVADANGIGISESILSQIENGKRDLSPKYLNLIEATKVFSREQLKQLHQQAIADMIRHEFGDTVSSVYVYFADEEFDEPSSE